MDRQAWRQDCSDVSVAIDEDEPDDHEDEDEPDEVWPGRFTRFPTFRRLLLLMLVPSRFWVVGMVVIRLGEE